MASAWRSIRDAADDPLFFFRDLLPPPPADDGGPVVSVHETDEAVVVVAEIPGFGPADVHISLEGDTLVLRGARLGDATPSIGPRGPLAPVFVRRVTLPFAPDPGSVEARVAEGVLRVMLRPSLRKRGFHIPVFAEAAAN
jgi:HSP20 family protein